MQNLEKAIDDSDCELMLFIECKDEEPKSAEASLMTLMARHHEYLVKVSTRFLNGTAAASRLDCFEQSQEIVLDVWKKIYDNAHKYDEADSPSQSSKHFRAWAGAILKNYIKDWLKTQNMKRILGSELTDIEEYEQHSDTGSEREGSINIGRFGRDPALSMHEEKYPHQERCSLENTIDPFQFLSEKESDVIRAILIELGTELISSNLDHGKLKTIAEMLNTTPENVRQLKSRAIKKLKKEWPLVRNQK